MGKDDKIKLLEVELNRMKKYAGKQIPFQNISAEAKANYENLASLEYDNAIRTDFKKTDTISIFEVKWNQDVSGAKIARDNQKIHDWLKIRLNDSTVQLRQADD